MLLTAHSVFSKSRQVRGIRNGALVDQLLLILSDGRGVDESTVSHCNPPYIVSIHVAIYFQTVAIRQLTEIGVFCVFIILDSLSKVRKKLQ